jgi:cephalosporin-C deacetylase
MKLFRRLKFYTLTFFLLLSACFTAFAQHGQKEDEGEVFIEVKSGTKNALFKGDEVIDYKLKVKSTYTQTQDGKLTYEILTDDFKKLSSNQIPVHLTKNSSETYSVSIPKKAPGFYRVHFQLNLTTYDDTVRRVFGVDPEKIVTTLHKPADFDAFWKGTQDTLAMIKPQFKATEDKKLSTKEKTVYLVEFKSWENVPIRGWLTVPKQGNNFPVLYRVPGYTIDMKPDYDKEDFAVFTINVRGNGNSREIIAPDYKQYNLVNIESRDKYIYRGTYMDCLRGVQFIAAMGKGLKLNPNKIVVEGGSQGGALAVMVAALDKRVKLCTFQVPLYADMHDSYDIGSSYAMDTWPTLVFHDYIKKHPGFTKEKLLKVWDYYDPQNFATEVQCKVLMGIGLLDEFCPPRCSFGMYNRFANTGKEFFVVPDKAHEVNFTYFTFQYFWLKEDFRMP